MSVILRSEPGASLKITITGEGSPPVSPLKGLTVNPDALFVGETQKVIIRAQIPYDVMQLPPLVTLHRIDTNGTVISIEGQLTDDGDLNNSDEIAGDGILSIRKSFYSDVQQSIRLQIAVQQSNQVFLSQTFLLPVFSHLTDAQVTNILIIQETALQHFQVLMSTTNIEAAATMVLGQLRSDTNILQAEISGSGDGIWLQYVSGVLGALSLYPDGKLGGLNLFPTMTNSAPPVLPTVTLDNAIKSKNAIVLAPFRSALPSEDDMAKSVYDIINNSACPKFDVTSLENGSVTVDVVKTLNLYGLIVINTHGFTVDKPAQVAFATREPFNNATKSVHEIDYQQHRLVSMTVPVCTFDLFGICFAHEHVWAIRPSFINTYAGNGYPDSLVLMGSCDSTYNTSMSDAFSQHGAKAYLGYSPTVDALFVKQSATDFFHKFLEDSSVTSAGEAFTPNQHDNSTPPAYFTLLPASSALQKPVFEISDGSFELGTLGAWQASGDGRVVSQLGQFGPTDGAYMAVISTGLGFTTTSGSIEQKLCLPAAAKTLDFKWNFNSEEFVEYCGSRYQDFFTVDIITSAGAQNVFYRKIDDLCGSVFRSNLRFDQSSGDCQPSAGVGFGTGGNDCTVWSTGWQSQSIDISAIAVANQNKAVTIRFSAGDIGDSIFDTAILLDNIRISQ
jgi:hypothetical protein